MEQRNSSKWNATFFLVIGRTGRVFHLFRVFHVREWNSWRSWNSGHRDLDGLRTFIPE